MGTITSNIVVPDAISALPAQCRRGGGRNHKPFWSHSNQLLEAFDPSGLTFKAEAVTPQRMVTFGRRRLSFSFVSEKTRTGQQGEGPWEFLLAKFLEGTANIVSYQFHNLKITWAAGGETVKTYRPDAAWVDTNGVVTCAEVKASRGYFGEPDTRSICDAARAGLEKLGIRFAEITGDALQDDRRRAYNIGRVFVDRLTAVSPRQIDAVRDRLEVGPVALGKLREIVGVRPSATVQTVNALMVRRHVEYDLSSVVTPDLPIHAAKAAPAKIPDITRLGA